LSEVSRGAAVGDVDNDGDLDILVTNNGGPVRLLVNDPTSANHWLQVKLEGVNANRDAIGARVGLLREDGTVTWRRARTDGSYLSASDPRVHFGLASRSGFTGIVVEWPGGGREVWSGLAADRIATLKQHGAGRDP